MASYISLKSPSYSTNFPFRSQFALNGSSNSLAHNGAFRASGFGTQLRKTPQNVDLSPISTSPNGLGVLAEELQLKLPNLDNNNDRFQAKLKANANILLSGESQYYPRVTDRADV